MTCEQARTALPVYLDGELDPSLTLEVQQHVNGCAACAEIARSEEAFRSAFREGSLRFEASPEFTSRVRKALSERSRTLPTRSTPLLWTGIAAAFVLGVALTVLTARLGVAPSPERALADDVLAGHLRSLQAGHLTDVPSSDQHTVKPWFAGRLDFSPDVPDLTGEGFPLVGGRLDYLAGRPVAAVVYRRRQHVINVFSWPAAPGPEAAPVASTKSGYHLVRWEKSGMTSWAVSDLDPRELERFGRLLAGQGR